jgi:hypothetical protein
VSSLDGADHALTLIAERNESIHQINEMMNEKYDYGDMLREATNLQRAVDAFLISKKISELEHANVKLTVVRPHSRYWDGERLKNLVPKRVWLEITKQTPDPDMIEDAIRRGLIKREEIEAAYVEEPKAAYVKKNYGKKDGEEKANEEAERVKEAMGS